MIARSPVHAPTRFIGAPVGCAQTARLHVSIFLGMSVVLLVLVVWFIRELQAAEQKEKAEKNGAKKKE